MKKLLIILFVAFFGFSTALVAGDSDKKASATITVKQKQLNDYNVYPNPINAGSTLSLEVDTKHPNFVQVFALDIIGNKVFDKELLIENGFQKFNLDTFDFLPGIYFLHILQDEDVEVFKLIVRNN